MIKNKLDIIGDGEGNGNIEMGQEKDFLDNICFMSKDFEQENDEDSDDVGNYNMQWGK